MTTYSQHGVKPYYHGCATPSLTSCFQMISWCYVETDLSLWTDGSPLSTNWSSTLRPKPHDGFTRRVRMWKCVSFSSRMNSLGSGRTTSIGYRGCVDMRPPLLRRPAR